MLLPSARHHSKNGKAGSPHSLLTVLEKVCQPVYKETEGSEIPGGILTPEREDSNNPA